MTWWAFDIECESWDRLVHGSAIAEDGRVVHMREPEDVAAWYRSLPKNDVVWAHNGGGYDYIALIDYTRDLSWSGRMAGSAMVSCRAKGGAECRDTVRMFPSSLAKWTGRKDALGLPCTCPDDCGGYCSIRRDMPAEQRRRLADYCDQDCRAILDTLRSDLLRLEGDGLLVMGRGGLPRLTFGSVSWHSAATMAGIDPGKLPSGEREYRSEYHDGRRCYYGGRCEVGRLTADSAWRYDVHAMYPWALTLPVPIAGRRKSLIGSAAMAAMRAMRPGAYYAVVSVPDTDLPPLPHRYLGQRGKGRLTPDRLVWSTGRIEGWWTHIELAAAESYGVTIEKVVNAVVWQGEEAVYKPYVEHIYDCRDRARRNGDDRWAGLLKWFANALSGKLAQQPIATQVRAIGDNEPEPLGWHRVGGRVWYNLTTRVAPNCRPIQAAVLTSRARLKLLDRLHRHSGQWLYCDTDSTYLVNRDDRDVHESELGTFGCEGSATEWLALSPKLYRYLDQNGVRHVRAKGIPRPEWGDLDMLLRGWEVTRRVGVHRLRSGHGRFTARAVVRTHRDAVPAGLPSRCGTRHVLPDGRTRPLCHVGGGSYV